MARYYPKNISATTVIPFDNPVTYIPAKTITGAVTFTKTTTSAQAGYCAIIRVIADGTNVPDLSAFKSIGTGTYDNTNGVVNQLWFVFDGVDYCVAITHPVAISGGGGDTTPPGIVTVSVENAEPNVVLLAYGETLDSGSIPATSAYTVTVNGTTRIISAVAITGSNVKVTFGGSAIVSTDSITLDYVVPGTNPIQDVAGNDAAALTGVIVGNNVSGAEDAYTTAWATASGIAAGSYRSAVDTFVKALRTASILTTHFDFIHILCGGSAAACKFNLIDPTDADGSYRLTFVNSPTFASTGITTDGSTQYINSHFIGGLASKASSNDYHLSAYQRTAAGVDGAIWGVDETATAEVIYTIPKAASGSGAYKDLDVAQQNFTPSTAKGLWMTIKTATDGTIWQDGVQKGTGADSGAGNAFGTVQPLTFNAYNSNGSNVLYHAAEISLISGGKGMTSTQRTAFESAIANLVSALGL